MPMVALFIITPEQESQMLMAEQINKLYNNQNGKHFSYKRE